MTSYPIIHKSILALSGTQIDSKLLKRLLQKRPQVYINNGSFYKLRNGSIGYDWETVDKNEYLTNEEIKLSSMITISTAINFKDKLNTFGIYIGQCEPQWGPLPDQDPQGAPGPLSDMLYINAQLFFTDISQRFSEIKKFINKKNVFCYLVPTVPIEHHPLFLEIYLKEAAKYGFITNVYLNHFKKFPAGPWPTGPKVHIGSKNIVELLNSNFISPDDLIVGLWHACPNSYIGNDFHISINKTGDSESSYTSTNHKMDLNSFDFFKVY